jgi:hypothetical protein
MNPRRDEIGALREVIGREVVYLKHFEGKILDNNDPLLRGRIKVSIPELMWETPIQVPWIEPEYHFNQITPDIGTYVIVYFKNGDIDHPVYRGRTGEIKPNRLDEYKDPNTAVLFRDDGEDPLTVVYHRDDKSIEFLMGGTDKITALLDTSTKKLEFKILEEEGISLTLDADTKSIDCTVGEKSNVLIEDGAVTVTVDKAVAETDGSKWTFNANGGIIELESTKCTICGNLEVSK